MMCMYVGMCEDMGRWEDNFVELVHSLLLYVGFKYQTQVTRPIG